MAGQKLYVLDYFELKGDRALRYKFQLAKREGNKLNYISLGSYDSTTEYSRIAKNIGPKDRIYHLDAYGLKGDHELFQMYKTEPNYLQTKILVIKILEGKIKSMSSTKLNGKTINLKIEK